MIYDLASAEKNPRSVTERGGGPGAGRRGGFPGSENAPAYSIIPGQTRLKILNGREESEASSAVEMTPLGPYDHLPANLVWPYHVHPSNEVKQKFNKSPEAGKNYALSRFKISASFNRCNLDEMRTRSLKTTELRISGGN